MQISNNITKQNKNLSFGVRKTATIEQFVNEIKEINPRINQHIDNLPVIQQIRQNDTFETLVNNVNADRRILGNKRKIIIDQYKKFKNFVTTIGIKIYENLMNIGVNLDGFILKTENEQGPSENIDILREYKKRQASAQYYQAHRDEIKQ